MMLMMIYSVITMMMSTMRMYSVILKVLLKTIVMMDDEDEHFGVNVSLSSIFTRLYCTSSRLEA